MFLIAGLPPGRATTAVALVPAARCPVRLRTCFVYVQRPAIEIRTVETIDCRRAFRIDTHLDKGKAPGLPGLTIHDNIDPIDGPVRLERRPDGVFRGPKIEVSDKNILHFFIYFLNLQRS